MACIPTSSTDAAWWEADDLWSYSFFALLLYVRVAAERTGRSVEDVARSIADRRGVTLGTPDSAGGGHRPVRPSEARPTYPPATKATTT